MTKKPNANKNIRRGRRAKRFSLPFGFRSELSVSVRWFRTQKSSRSKRRSQRVFRLYGLPVREVSIAKLSRPRRRKRLGLLGYRAGSLVLIFIGLSGAVYSSQHLTAYRTIKPVTTFSAVTKPTPHVKSASVTTLPRSVPEMIQIDKIALSAPIVSVGLDVDQTLQVPEYTVTGWYYQGPTPGEKGPAVIVGHLDHLNEGAVFWRLRELVPGDVITVNRADKSAVRFKVDTVLQLGQDSFPTQAVYGPLEYAGIRLITCGGTYDPATNRYSENTIVFGSMIE